MRFLQTLIKKRPSVSFIERNLGTYFPQSSLLAYFGSYRSSWWEYNLILSALYRQHELKSLITWSALKNLSGQQRFYTARLIEEENKLIRYTRRFPCLFLLARIAQLTNYLVSPTPQYRKGYAAKYRLSILKGS